MRDRVEGAGEADGKVGILIVEDQDMIAEMLRRAIDGEGDLRVVGVVGSVRDAVESARELHPDVVVMDYGLPDGNGAEATRLIKGEEPDVEVIMLTGMSGGAVLAEALDAGCSGFVPKEAHYSELLIAIRGVLGGQVQVAQYLMTDLVMHLRPHPSAVGSDLTARELEVLRLLAAGRSTTEIAAQLFLSVHTVRNHIANLLSKLQAKSRLEAVAIALRQGIVTMPAD